jgi:predicted enzyme related to lactoylglutathione lyase
MGQPVVHFEIGGKNSKKLQSFYASQFGWKIDAKNPMRYGVVDTGARGKTRGINGGIFETQPGATQSPVTIYVQVNDIDATLKKIGKAGGKTVHPRTPLPGMVTFAQFADPEGNVVGLVEAKIPPAPKPAGKKAAKKAAAGKKTSGKKGKKARR